MRGLQPGGSKDLSPPPTLGFLRRLGLVALAVDRLQVRVGFSAAFPHGDYVIDLMRRPQAPCRFALVALANAIGLAQYPQAGLLPAIATKIALIADRQRLHST